MVKTILDESVCPAINQGFEQLAPKKVVKPLLSAKHQSKGACSRVGRVGKGFPLPSM